MQYVMLSILLVSNLKLMQQNSSNAENILLTGILSLKPVYLSQKTIHRDVSSTTIG